MSKQPTRGAFGGLYGHEVIRQLRAELSKTSLILAALIEHTGISQEELQRITSEFFTKKQAELKSGNLDKKP